MMTVPAAASHHSAGMLAEICTAAGTVSRAKRRALLLTRGRRVPVVLDMKLILSVMRPAPMPGNRTRALWPVQPLPPFETSSGRLPRAGSWRCAEAGAAAHGRAGTRAVG
jgi:hypothetical protein